MGSEEIFQTYTTNASLDDSQMVTLQLESGSLIQFQVDTGAQRNVVPLSIYKKATNDFGTNQPLLHENHSLWRYDIASHWHCSSACVAW